MCHPEQSEALSEMICFAVLAQLRHLAGRAAVLAQLRHLAGRAAVLALSAAASANRPKSDLERNLLESVCLKNLVIILFGIMWNKS
jgi:hypothetical protein